MTAVLQVRKLCKNFAGVQAVDGISLAVRRGEVLGFLGPNGAGKSTTMKMAAGFLPPDSGEVMVCGIDMLRTPLPARQRLGYLPEGAPLYDEMTVRGFLRFCGRVRGLRGARLRSALEGVAERLQLASVWERGIGGLSKGYRRRVGLAQAIIHQPDVLILDEPTDGLDPNQKVVVRQLIRDMAQHCGIIVSTHILEEVPAVCDRVVVIAQGRVVAEGTADELAQQVPEGVEPSLEAAFRHLTTRGARLQGAVAPGGRA